MRFSEGIGGNLRARISSLVIGLRRADDVVTDPARGDGATLDAELTTPGLARTGGIRLGAWTCGASNSSTMMIESSSASMVEADASMSSLAMALALSVGARAAMRSARS